MAEGKRPQRRPQRRLGRRLGRRLEEVAKAVGGRLLSLQTPLRLALAVRRTVAGQRLGALEGGGGGSPPLPMHPWEVGGCQSLPMPRDVLEARGEGGLGRISVPKMAPADFPNCKFRVFPRWSLWFGAGGSSGGGAYPPASCGVQPFPYFPAPPPRTLGRPSTRHPPPLWTGGQRVDGAWGTPPSRGTTRHTQVLHLRVAVPVALRRLRVAAPQPPPPPVQGLGLPPGVRLRRVALPHGHAALARAPGAEVQHVPHERGAVLDERRVHRCVVARERHLRLWHRGLVRRQIHGPNGLQEGLEPQVRLRDGCVCGGGGGGGGRCRAEGEGELEDGAGVRKGWVHARVSNAGARPGGGGGSASR